MNKFNITLGSDPEIFIENDKEIVSGEGIIPGSKHNPEPISEEGHCIQLDNIAMEFNIPPCKTEDDFVREINFIKDYSTVLLKSHGLKISTKASAEINPIYLQSEQAQTFGCEPDFNVYLQDVNTPPDNKTNLRCVGGHIHIGIPEEYLNQDVQEQIVKAFDIFVTLPSLLLDNDERRREMYGKAGAFRFKDFGVECRQLSNFWIHSDENTRWVYKQTIKAVETVLDNRFSEYEKKYSDLVRNAIDTNDKEQAKNLLIEIEKTEKILTN